MHIKHLVNNLAIIGQTLNYNDIITYLLVGLKPKYDSLVTMNFACDDSLILEEVYYILLTCEA